LEPFLFCGVCCFGLERELSFIERDVRCFVMSSGKKRGCLVPILVGVIVLLLVVIGVYWWMNRPIEPVVLSEKEKVELAEKVDGVQGGEYVKGKNEIVFTQRELNGLLNEKTSYGEKIEFDLVTDAVNETNK